jgi:hypothetical protein
MSITKEKTERMSLILKDCKITTYKAKSKFPTKKSEKY